jgi:hypothetical protein
VSGFVEEVFVEEVSGLAAVPLAVAGTAFVEVEI